MTQRNRYGATHDAELLTAAIEVHCILLDLDGIRELDCDEQLQLDASEATIRRIMPRYFMEVER